MAQYQGKFAIVGFCKIETDSSVTFNRYFGHVRVIVAIERVPFGGQYLKRKFYVLGGNRLAILEPCFLAQVERNVTPVLGRFYGFRNQSIGRERFVC